MKYWLDTEFIEDGETIDLISIGIVAEDGRTWYGQSLDCDLSRASNWVRENVLPHLYNYDTESRHITNSPPWHLTQEIAAALIEFCDPEKYGKPEFWGYFADYDWVVLCQLFGTMMDLPKGWPMYCRDIKQWCDQLGNPKLPEQGKGEHHALADAKWNKVAWEFLRDYTPPTQHDTASAEAQLLRNEQTATLTVSTPTGSHMAVVHIDGGSVRVSAPSWESTQVVSAFVEKIMKSHLLNSHPQPQGDAR